MKFLSHKFAPFLLALLPVAGWLFAQQPSEPRAGRLDNNPEYMALVREDRVLQARQDSIAHAMEALRTQLRSNPAERNRLSDQILQLEMEIFEIRSAKGRLVDRITELEQEWVLAQLAGSDGSEDAAWPAEPMPEEHFLSRGPRVRNLIYNSYFRENLPAADYAALVEAQQQEMQAIGLVNRYFANYDSLAMLARDYAGVATEEEALAIQEHFDELQEQNDAVADELAAVWNAIFDNKSFAYSYVLDKLNRDKLLEEQEYRLSEAMLQLAELRGRTTSDAVADYFLRKQVSVGNECEVASLLGLEAARDSLVQVMGQLQAIDFRVPKIAIAERIFIEYEEVTFPGASKYTTQNPIPECRVYERGTVYRILLGRFTAKRPVSTFRGAAPLSYRVDDEKKWNYYAGALATYAEAEAAQKLLKEKGFLRPEIVVWRNGELHNLSREPEEHTQAYRVEIANAEALPADIRTAITEVAGDAELSKVGQNLFIVGPFYDRAAADAVADVVRQADSRWQIKVTEIGQ